jgi:hypothetical protein
LVWNRKKKEKRKKDIKEESIQEREGKNRKDFIEKKCE